MKISFLFLNKWKSRHHRWISLSSLRWLPGDGAQINQFLCFFSLWLWASAATAASIETHFLVLADIHLNSTATQAMNFRPSKQTLANDLDGKTFQKLMAAVKLNIAQGKLAKPAFILLLGDIQGHLRKSRDIHQNESEVFRAFKDNFPDIPTFYVYGNNDSLKANYGPFRSSKALHHARSPYDIALQTGWNNGFLSSNGLCTQGTKAPCLIHENPELGFYSALAQEKLRLVALNSVLFSNHRGFFERKNAQLQLQWLDKQFQEAKKNKERVLIAMHIPPGYNIYDKSTFWKKDDLTSFLALIQTHSSNLLGILSAHTHQDELKIILNQNNDIISGVFYTPALSTVYGNAPAMKLFQLKKRSRGWVLANYESYHFSLIDSEVKLNRLYDYRDYYCDSQQNDMLQCLNHVTPKKIKVYLSAKNENDAGIMDYPEHFILKMGGGSNRTTHSI